MGVEDGGEPSKSRTSFTGALSRREEKLVRALRRRRERESRGRFLAEGTRATEDLLASGLPVELIVTSSSLEDTPRGRALLAMVERGGIPHRRVDPVKLAELAGTETPQGVVAVAIAPAASAREVLAPEGRRVLLVLDGVQDPGNLGTLARTAEALGAAGLVLLPGSVDPWNAKAVRAAMGATFRLPLVALELEDAYHSLREHGYTVLASAAGAPPLLDVPDRAALVVGNEGAGVSEAGLHGADAVVGVPLLGRAESLNVAAAAAILLHELLRQTPC
jgi:RNA methyltransferase, TrmH family